MRPSPESPPSLSHPRRPPPFKEGRADVDKVLHAFVQTYGNLQSVGLFCVISYLGSPFCQKSHRSRHIFSSEDKSGVLQGMVLWGPWGLGSAVYSEPQNQISIHPQSRKGFLCCFFFPQASDYSSSFHRYLKHVLCCSGQLAFYPILLESLNSPTRRF